MKEDRKRLDQEIKDALEGMEVPYDGSSWDLLAGKMQEEPDLMSETESDKQFDNSVKQKIGRSEPAFNPAHWRIMAERIHQEFSFQEKLVRYKIAEITVMMLIFLTVYQIQPLNEGIKKKIIPGIERILHVNDKNQKGQASLENDNSIEAIGSANIADNTIDENNLLANGALSSHSAGLAITKEEGDLVEKPFKRPFGYNRLPLHLSSKPVQKSNLVFRAKENRKSVSIMESLESSLEDMSLLDENTNLGLGTTAINTEKDPSKVRVSMFSATEYNYIKTPYDPIYPLEEYSRYAPGYGGGITFGLSFGKWEVETGGIYASKEYEPRVPDEVVGGLLTTGLITISFENIQLNMLEVPVNLRYNFGQLQKWRFYGQTGASLHLAMQAHYDKFPNNFYSGFARQTVDNSSLAKKKFPDGLLEGGNFQENSYFTANLGLGVERLLSTRWSLFLQPSVQAYLLPGYNYGLGPNQDRISTFSILTGARVTLW
ncbi:MAG: hypothetical protein KDC24_02160 [Saprospiraceae bacterium]|nr:hypothetical protein [Saprospiraceae bacterium]